ncbi:MAG: methyl-accepting chemotaxis protein [Arenibacterium sp.]
MSQNRALNSQHTETPNAITEARERIDALDRASARIEFDMDGTVLDANDRFLSAVGYDLNDIRGQNHRMFLFPEDTRSPSYQELWDKLRRGVVCSAEFRRRRRDGSELWIAASYSPVLARDGTPYRVIKNAVDVTERVRAVNVLQSGLKRMAAGDLETTIEERFAPEFDDLRNDFNTALLNLAHALSEVQESADEIRNNSQILAGEADKLAGRVTLQREALASTSKSIGEMTNTVNEAAQSAEKARSQAAKTRESADAGTELMSQLRSAMDAIANSSVEVSKITNVIDQISFQTNLLALNAGVEAARAGEAGLGFAVVASEVRALAQRSSEAATQIGELIRAADNQVKGGVNLMTQTAESFDQIAQRIAEVQDQVHDISEGTQSQSVKIGDVRNALKDMETLVMQNATMFEGSTATSRDMMSKAKLLRNTTDTSDSRDHFSRDGSRSGGRRRETRMVS